ncbi:hypothetical protein Taro_029752 [Colocasia esculenta]|uniref:Uncharacterized protein n=1 Tax=Colocasia esculenta TaxID=4460 RepID=A0A843VEL6_COLES|nr:hypothetical protein [Colocasia esculenta]
MAQSNEQLRHCQLRKDTALASYSEIRMAPMGPSVQVGREDGGSGFGNRKLTEITEAPTVHQATRSVEAGRQGSREGSDDCVGVVGSNGCRSGEEEAGCESNRGGFGDCEGHGGGIECCSGEEENALLPFAFLSEDHFLEISVSHLPAPVLEENVRSEEEAVLALALPASPPMSEDLHVAMEHCSDKLGLSLELGSFAAGVMISTTDLSQHTLEQEYLGRLEKVGAATRVRGCYCSSVEEGGGKCSPKLMLMVLGGWRDGLWAAPGKEGAAAINGEPGGLIWLNPIFEEDWYIDSSANPSMTESMLPQAVDSSSSCSSSSSTSSPPSLASSEGCRHLPLEHPHLQPYPAPHGIHQHQTSGRKTDVTTGITSLARRTRATAEVTTPLLFKLIPAVIHLGILLRWFAPDGGQNEIAANMPLRERSREGGSSVVGNGGGSNIIGDGGRQHSAGASVMGEVEALSDDF